VITMTITPDAIGRLERFAPRMRPGDVLREQWKVIAATGVLLMLVGAALGFVRPPVYTGTVQLSVRIGTTEAAALNSTTAAAAAQAPTYSRLVKAAAVVSPVAQQLKMSSQDVAAAVNATPVPASPDLKLTASASTPERANELANAMAWSLNRWVQRVANESDGTPQLESYRRASADYARKRDDLTALQAQERRAPSPEMGDRVRAAAADLDAARLRRDTLQSRYETTQLAPQTSLFALNTAEAAVSDRFAKMQLFGFVGLLGGCTLGAALVLRRARLLERARDRLD